MCLRGTVLRMSLHRLIRSCAMLVGVLVVLWERAMRQGVRWMI